MDVFNKAPARPGSAGVRTVHFRHSRTRDCRKRLRPAPRSSVVRCSSAPPRQGPTCRLSTCGRTALRVVLPVLLAAAPRAVPTPPGHRARRSPGSQQICLVRMQDSASVSLDRHLAGKTVVHELLAKLLSRSVTN